ncbi:MAG: dihydrolipoyl dehydrogenase [Oscillospiraceae bacterium]
MDFDLFVIGAGPGGYVAALEGARLGMKTAVAESDLVGGTCLNRGCIPTKALLHSAELFARLREAESFGISADNPAFDFSKMQSRKDEIVQGLRGGIETLFEKNKVELIRGRAVITAKNEVSVGDRKYTSKNILIACGGTASIPPIDGADTDGVLTSDSFLNLSKIPKSAVIVGGGVIGVEFATMLNDLGCEVSIIEAESRILPLLDREISQNLAMILKKRGVCIEVGASVKKIEKDGVMLTCAFEQKQLQKSAAGEKVLVCIGRKPAAEEVACSCLNIKKDRGYIVVDSAYETSQKGIFAVGDVVAGGIQLAHAASAEAINAVQGMARSAPPYDMGAVPSCIYTNPEIACVGMTDKQAQESGHSVKICKAPMMSNPKIVIENADRSFVKLVFDGETEVLLGAQLMCPRATDIIAELSTALANKLTRTDLLAAVRAHPTFAETISEALKN